MCTCACVYESVFMYMILYVLCLHNFVYVGMNECTLCVYECVYKCKYVWRPMCAHESVSVWVCTNVYECVRVCTYKPMFVLSLLFMVYIAATLIIQNPVTPAHWCNLVPVSFCGDQGKWDIYLMKDDKCACHYHILCSKNTALYLYSI